MRMSPKKIIGKIKRSDLIGRGGANFPTGLKWELTRAARGKKVLICNADEGEPGTFKDKFIIKNNPETLLQGIAIGGYVLGAECFIYLRGEYATLKQRVVNTIKKLGFDITVVVGAGAYVCGEETSLIESLEGKRGAPRLKPPYPTVEGLWKKPTCINNVETLANIPLLLTKKGWDKNLRLFSLSGDLNDPGVYEIPLGTRLGVIIENAEPKKKIESICLGYAGGIIPYERFKNLIVDHETFSEKSVMLGSCAMIALGKTDVVKLVKNIAEFFVHESCGKCVPCREGGYRILEILNSIDSGRGTKNDMKELKVLADYLDICFCSLGKSYGFTINSALKYFKKEFDKKCR